MEQGCPDAMISTILVENLCRRRMMRVEMRSMLRRRSKIAGHFPSRRWSGIAGGVLLGIGILWIGWLVLVSNSSSIGIPLWPGVLNASTPVNVQATPLLAEGISLSQTSQTPAISQKQAIFLANQLEPDAAAQAKSVIARFVLLNYATTTSATHQNFVNTPVWMIWYQHIPLVPNDPAASTRTAHDLYVFLDGTSGKEVLKVWV